MPQNSHDYFRYLPCSGEAEAWGLVVTASGFTEIAPGASYPPARHPADHHFDWDGGRTLQALQIVSIQAGRGWFETKALGAKRITAGMAFLVLPGVWHRYRPEPNTGWTESWVEMRGSAVGRLARAGVLKPRRAIKTRVADSRLDEALQVLHARVRKTSARFDSAITAGAYEVLAAWAAERPAAVREPVAAEKIEEAERYLAAHAHEAINLRELAARRGMAYSYFRKLFQEHTGYAPWSYVLRLRLVRARRLLLESPAKLEMIAEELGFSSAFHFSAAFKAAFGESPSVWRTRNRAPTSG